MREIKDKITQAIKHLEKEMSCRKYVEICVTTHVQNCHVCESVYCGDNFNPIAKALVLLREIKRSL